jgi:hypothetical protein
LILALLCVAGSAPHSIANSRGAAGPTTAWLPVVSAPGPAADEAPFYAFYYLWWSTSHWQERLGQDYPFDDSWPMPGSADPTTGCGAATNYSGGIISDIPVGGAYDMLASSIMETHVREASEAGLTGFLAGWEGTGLASQGVSDRGYNQRLDRLVQTIAAYNQATGRSFRFIIDYEVFGEIKTPEQISNDVDYLLERYGSSSNWGRIDGRLVLRWSNTRLFPIETLRAISERYRDRLFIIGEERSTTWTSERASYLDGTGHYWSTQDPWGNPQSFDQERAFAAKVRADGKRWFAPLAPGYNDQLQDQVPGQPVDPNDCVPRNGTTTMRALFEGNRTTNPDGWFVISWNEWVEHTYIEPSKRYGTAYVDELARIISDARR